MKRDPSTTKSFTPEPLAQDELLRGFEVFNQTALQLQKTYRGFEERVQELSQELAEKNKELERNLAEKEQMQRYLSSVFESTTVGLLVADAEGAVTSLNQSGAQLLGTSEASVQGLPLHQVLAGGIHPWECEPGGLEELVRIEEREAELKRPDGDTRRVRLSASAMRSSEGTLTGVIVNLQDVTELKRLEAEAERRNRMAGMGEVAASVAHTIRNPLGSIELFSGLLKQEIRSERGQELLQHLSSAAQGINLVISNLIEYSQPKPLESGRVLDLHELLKQNLRFSHQLVDYGHVQVRLDLQADHPCVYGDEEQLKQVFSNLLLNALQATLEPGELRIATRNLESRNRKILDRFSSGGTRMEALQLLELSFEDPGVGIPTEVLPRIFDPFFTTKEHGAGLGLAIVRRILDAHGAVLEAHSHEGEGSRLTLLFPVQPPSA